MTDEINDDIVNNRKHKREKSWRNDDKPPASEQAIQQWKK